jgi:hypothetical protein
VAASLVYRDAGIGDDSVKFISLVILTAMGLLAQPLTVTLKPISLVTTKKAIDSGKQAGLWTVSVCSDWTAKS